MQVGKGGSNLYAQVVSGLIQLCPASSITADACVGSVCVVLQLLNSAKMSWCHSMKGVVGSLNMSSSCQIRLSV